ncbi:hypothetical protein PHLCEN_2v11289 [Hermanssonia centrifuga]|uniref:Uncharacterized protein n=1 Tax=Hermanssonia centrifuga TaxID=98765 RepID=A0A2R6NKD9_9APHY|nr:hypothetical protein PHLCEN_2v11289 [Hermanssonia centrifuga]
MKDAGAHRTPSSASKVPFLRARNASATCARDDLYQSANAASLLKDCAYRIGARRREHIWDSGWEVIVSTIQRLRAEPNPEEDE